MKNKIVKNKIIVNQLACGNELSLTTYTIKGDKPGLKIYLQSSVHGAELQGNGVILELINFFKKHSFSGEIVFVPMANPIASSRKVGTYTYGRFSSITGNNWNRLYSDLLSLKKDKFEAFFKDKVNHSKEKYKSFLLSIIEDLEKDFSKNGPRFEQLHFLNLQKLAVDADIVIDLHTGARATRYLYVSKFCKDKALDFPIENQLIIPNEFSGAMDEATFMPWVYFDKATGIKSDFESYTFELGSEERVSLSESKDDAISVLKLLKCRNVHGESFNRADKPIRRCYLDNFKSFYAIKGGLVEYIKRPGELIKAGEVILNYIDVHNMDNEDCVVPLMANEDQVILTQTPSSGVQKGQELYCAMTSFSTC